MAVTSYVSVELSPFNLCLDLQGDRGTPGRPGAGGAPGKDGDPGSMGPKGDSGDDGRPVRPCIVYFSCSYPFRLYEVHLKSIRYGDQMN